MKMMPLLDEHWTNSTSTVIPNDQDDEVDGHLARKSRYFLYFNALKISSQQSSESPSRRCLSDYYDYVFFLLFWI